MENLDIKNKKINDSRWYVVIGQSGHEKKIQEDLINKLKKTTDNFEVRVIFENVKSEKNGVVRVKNAYPTYIFVNVEMSKEIWFAIRNTDKVKGILGSKGEGALPQALTKMEAKRMLSKEKKVIENKEKTLYTANFKVGDYVKINDNIFQDEVAQVIDMNYYKGEATVNIEIFGRATPTKILFENCEPIT